MKGITRERLEEGPVRLNFPGDCSRNSPTSAPTSRHAEDIFTTQEPFLPSSTGILILLEAKPRFIPRG
jgi:hypothetical protein